MERREENKKKKREQAQEKSREKAPEVPVRRAEKPQRRRGDIEEDLFYELSSFSFLFSLSSSITFSL